jgi:heparan-alpha-glucosaminide N-acetyltransferase
MPQAETVLTQSTTLTASPTRVESIDILRALTMILMIFVNDLWSLKDIPVWLEHVPRGVDGMGLADSVFPAFLFIVGMSLPYAINARRKKGDSNGALVGHVIGRSVALLVMGVFLVNGESINEAATGMTRGMWNSLSCLSFILIWNAYPKTSPNWIMPTAKGIGVAFLLTLAIVYRGGEGGEETLTRFEPHWWGILGLIGWSYLAAALVTVFAHSRMPILVLAWVGFATLSMADQAGLVPQPVHLIPEAISGGTLVGLTMGGVVISTLFQRYRKRSDNGQMTLTFLLISGVLVGLSIYTRQFWGLSKLGATPAWLFLCSAFTILAFMGIYWLTDVSGKANWLTLIKPAGTDTLLCYLLPYFAYALMTSLHLHLPEALLIGGIGLLKSFLFALLCAWTTGRLNRVGVRLRL